MKKLFGAMVLMVLTAVLTGYNLNNRTDIWFFHTFKDVPVFFALVVAFIAGVLVALPFVLHRASKNSGSFFKNKKKEEGPVDYDAQE